MSSEEGVAVSLRSEIREKLEGAVRGQGYGSSEQERDQAIEVAALAFAFALLRDEENGE